MSEKKRPNYTKPAIEERRFIREILSMCESFQ